MSTFTSSVSFYGVRPRSHRYGFGAGVHELHDVVEVVDAKNVGKLQQPLLLLPLDARLQGGFQKTSRVLRRQQHVQSLNLLRGQILGLCVKKLHEMNGARRRIRTRLVGVEWLRSDDQRFGLLVGEAGAV